MKIIANIVIVIGLSAFIYAVWPDSLIKQAPGVLVPDIPIQINLKVNDGVLIENYLVSKLAEFKLNAKVLSKEYYYFDRGSVVSPLDLALGWGPMSDQTIVDKIDISQSGRWYYWSANPLPIAGNVISDNSANMHIIPADGYVADQLDETIVGQIINLNGYLVKVIGPDGFVWQSSLTRTDRGNGACELFYVTSVSLVQ
ncbi:MAG: hypothetical protein KKA84_12255 [Bacteroidetes bacterium]|nr:hypothetical protein [Bacteroidota bacterium]